MPKVQLVIEPNTAPLSSAVQGRQRLFSSRPKAQAALLLLIRLNSVRKSTREETVMSNSF